MTSKTDKLYTQLKEKLSSSIGIFISCGISTADCFLEEEAPNLRKVAESNGKHGKMKYMDNHV